MKAMLAMLGVVLLLPLLGCRESEQGRPLSLEKGVYQGKTGTVLDRKTIDALERRAQYQGG